MMIYSIILIHFPSVDDRNNCSNSCTLFDALIYPFDTASIVIGIEWFEYRAQVPTHNVILHIMYPCYICVFEPPIR